MKKFMNFFFAIAAIGMLGVNTPKPVPSASPTAKPAAIVVHISEFKFKPDAFSVHEGDTVTFINDDAAAHTATADDKSFDSGNLDQNQKWSFTFKKAGTYSYVCTYHSMMKATIEVEPAAK